MSVVTQLIALKRACTKGLVYIKGSESSAGLTKVPIIVEETTEAAIWQLLIKMSSSLYVSILQIALVPRDSRLTCR